MVATGFLSNQFVCETLKPKIPRLQVITDEVLQTKYSHVELAEICLSAGADGIQYREKRTLDLSTRVKTAQAIKTLCDEYDATFIVNDFVDVVAEIGANALHLGRNDESIDSARQRLDEEVLIGGTANSINEAIYAANEDVDYLGVGPVFGTSSKAAPAPQLGLANLQQICDEAGRPVVAIGNIKHDNVVDVLAAGVVGIAVLSAVVCASDIGDATKRFMDQL